MKSLLLDTNAYSAFKRGHTDVIAILRSSQIAMSSIVLGELHGGFAGGTREAANRRELATFLASGRVLILNVDLATAEHYGAIFQKLRAAGTPIPINDMWLATTALQHQLGLFTFDKHFLAVEGLPVFSSLSEWLTS